MKTTSSKFCLFLTLMLAVALNVQAQWTQNSGTGPFDYENTANWNGGVINNVFATNVTTGMTITFGAPFTLSSEMLLGWSNSASVTFQSSSSSAQTIKFSPNGGIAMTNALGGTNSIGTVGNPLILDLNGAQNCTIGGVAGTSGSANAVMNVNAQIIDSGGSNNAIKLSGDRTFVNLLNNNNNFLGPVNFYALRGGSFTSIKPIGGGPSALGAPTDSTNGAISIGDSSSNGALRYTGPGDTSDRPWFFNVTFSNAVANGYALANAGTGLLKLTGPMFFPTNGTNGSQFVFSATNQPLELDGYIHGTGNSNGTYTFICFAGGPSSTGTNRVIVTGLTNDYRDFIISNVTFQYNNFAGAGVPSAIGAGSNVFVGGGSQGFGGWQPAAGQGSSFQYVGTTNGTFTRNIVFNGASFHWALDNAGSNTILTWSNNISFNSPASITAFNPHFVYINSLPNSTNVVYSYIPDANFNAGGTPIGITLGAGNPTGNPVNNGGLVQLLNPTNTFAGGAMVAYGRTLQAMTLADIGQPSSIGTATSGSLITENGVAVQLNGINLGSPDSSRGGFFSYIGTNDISTDQKITVFGPTFNSAVIELCGLRNDSPTGNSVHFTDPSAWILQPQGAAGGTNAFQIDLGGTAKTTNTLDGIIGDVPNNSNIPTPNSGNLLINGSAWRLTAVQTFTASNIVAGGTEIVDGSIASGLGTYVNANGVLAGTGTINENVFVATNGILAAGDGAIGTLTINGNVTNSGTIFMKLNATSNTCDQLALGANTLSYGNGILMVSNISGTLTTNSSFTLFTAGSIVGSFSSISPATPGSGLGWDTSSLGSGILKVTTAAVVLSQPRITSIVENGTSVILSGTNGTASGTYHVISSTNILTRPLTSWTTVTNGSFDGAGHFSITNSATNQQQFFIIEQP